MVQILVQSANLPAISGRDYIVKYDGLILLGGHGFDDIRASDVGSDG